MDEDDAPKLLEIPITNKLEEKIAAQFILFDEMDKKTIPFEDVGPFVHSLGIYANNEEIQDIVEESTNSQIKDGIHLAYLMPCLTTLIFEHKCMPPTSADILEAFYFLDPDRKGVLEIEVAKTIFSQIGDTFNEKEMDDFFRRAVDTRTKKINYEYLINSLGIPVKEEDNVYKMADDIEASKPKPVPKHAFVLPDL